MRTKNYLKTWSIALFALLLFGSSTGIAQTVTVGTTNGVNGTFDYPCPIQDFYYATRAQFLYTASELAAVGITSGATITEIGWIVQATAINGHLQEDYTISLLNTAVTTLDINSWEPGATAVYGPTNYAYTSGYAGNVMFTTSPFTYAGGNLIVEVCGGLPSGNYTLNPQCEQTTNLSFNGSHQWRQDMTTGCGTTDPTNFATETSRPVLVVTYIAGAPCSGTPTPGNTNASSNPVCANTNFSLSMQNFTLGSGVTYQWQSSPDGTTWTDIAGATNFTTTTSQATNTYYQCVVTCAGGGTGTSTPLLVNTGQCYYMCSQGNSVTLTDSTNAFYDSGGPNGNYQMGENCTLLVAPSCAVTITLSFTAFNGGFGGYMYVYDGQTTNDPLLLTASGSFVPAPVTCTSGYMLIVWSSDAFNSASTGWAATWTSVIAASTAPIASFGVSTHTPPLNAGVHFTDQSGGGIPTSWIWDFGDGDTSHLQNPTHPYAAPGTYYITLYAFSCTESDTAYDTVVVQNAPQVIVYPDTLSATVQCGDSATFQLIVKNLTGGDLVFNTDGSSSNNTIKVLSMKYGTDLFSEYPSTIAAINSFFTNYQLTETTTSNAATLANLLVGKNVLLIPEQETANPAVFNSFTSVFNMFLYNGGSIVQCGTSAGQDSTLTTTGLWHGQFSQDIGNGFTTFNVDSMAHPIMQGISGNVITAPSATDVIHFTDTDRHVLARYVTEDVVSYRKVNNGKVIYLGFDYFSANDDTKKMIANAIQWGGQTGLPAWISMDITTDTVSAGDSSIVNVVFHANGIPAGTYYGIIGVSTNDPNTPYVAVSCTMTVVGDPIIAMSETCLTFDTVLAGNSTSETFNIINNGCDSLIISQYIPSSPEFTVSAPTSILLPGTSMVVTVTFHPLTAGAFSGSLLIQNNDNDTTICLNGFAIPAPVIDATFNTVSQFVPACSGTDSTTFTIHNTGGSNLIFTISGTPSWATLSANSGTIAAGDSMVITVVMSSGTIPGGPVNANLLIASNDPQAPNRTVPLTMNVGTNPCFTINGVIDACTGIATFTSTVVVNAPTSWSWTFGDGGTGSTANPIHQYGEPTGTVINVMAIGCTGGGCDTEYVTLTMPLVTGPAAATCLPQTTDASTGGSLGIGIVNVTLGHINNASTNSSAGYQNFTCTDTTTLNPGDFYQWTVTTGQTYEETVKGYIDFNNDGDFDQVTELIFEDSAVVRTHGGLTIQMPFTAVLGVALRMRVESEYSGNPEPDGCSDLLYGQNEDYTVFMDTSYIVNHISQFTSQVAMAVYPNPFTKDATIEYHIAGTQKVSVEVFNLVGERVQQFASDEIQTAGKHTYTFNEETPGVYFIKLTVDGESQILKLVHVQ